MPLSDDEWHALARDLRRTVARAAPSWTDGNAHDPGVTLLALLAFVAEELVLRGDALSDDGRRLAARVAARLAPLGSTGAQEASNDGELVRPQYFVGQLLGADDFRAEQDYLLGRLSRHNRLLFGAGIVDGLEVTVNAASGGSEVVIAPGLAFDRRGREIFVAQCARIALPAAGTALLVQVAYREQPSANVPVHGLFDGAATDDAETTRATRIVETVEAALGTAPDERCVDIARVRRVRGRWRVDASFEPLRVRR